MISLRRPLLAAAGLAVLALAGCIPPSPEPTPAPSPAPAPAPAPPPVVQAPLPPAPENWIDMPQTPGDWRHVAGAGTSTALFGTIGAPPLLTIRCDRASRQVTISRPVSGSAAGLRPAPMRILTRAQAALSERLLPTRIADSGGWQIMATVAASDSVLDAIAVSRGRFAVETGLAPTVYAPAWPEVTRVVEDCR